MFCHQESCYSRSIARMLTNIVFIFLLNIYNVDGCEGGSVFFMALNDAMLNKIYFMR